MVKKIVFFFAYLLFFIVALIYFTPKSSIYFALEEELKKYDIVVSGEEIIDNGFTLEIKSANVSLKSIESATLSQTSIKIFVLYNSLSFKDILLSSTAKSFVPLHVDVIEIVYSISNPFVVTAYGTGEFGKVEAEFDIVDRNFHLDLMPSEVMQKGYRSTLSNLNKNDNGDFSYDKTF